MVAAIDTISTRTPGLAAGLVEAQRAAKSVAKDATNSFHKYKYASSEDVIEAARHALSAGDLALFADSATLRELIPGFGEGEAYEPPMFAVAVTYSLVHSSGETHKLASETPVIPEKGRPFDKALAAAKTFDLSYTLRSLLLLPRGTEDGDVDARDDRQRDGYDRTRALPPKAPPPAKIDPPKAAEAAKPAPVAPVKAPVSDEFRSWWNQMQGLGWGADDVRALVLELVGEKSVRDLSASERVKVAAEAQRRGAPASDNTGALDVLAESRGVR